MSRRPASITQADVRRIIAAAKQAGASKVELRVGGQQVFIHLESTGQEKPLEDGREIVL